MKTQTKIKPYNRCKLFLKWSIMIVIIAAFIVLTILLSPDMTGSATAASINCTDTDGGFNWTFKGTISGGTWKTTGKTYTAKIDSCVSTGTSKGKLLEGFCPDATHGFYVYKNCTTVVGTGYICDDGACVLDSDGDGVPDTKDICAGYNDNQDTDSDGVPDGCDICAGSDDAVDTDLDGTPEGCDSAPYFYFYDEQLLWTGNYADPSIIKFNESFLMYLNTFSSNFSPISSNKTSREGGYFVLSNASGDGLSWQQETDIIFSGSSTARAYVFPTGVRFYYPNNTQDNVTRAPGEELKEILSAFSEDGFSFVREEGVRISPKENLTAFGPTVIQLPNGTYRMFFSEGPNMGDGEIYSAISEEGFNWTRDENYTIAAEAAYEGTNRNQAMHPFAFPWQNGFLMFYGSNSKIYAASSNNGYNWTKLNYTGIDPGFDIDGYVIDNETMRVYYGTYSDATGGEVYTGLLRIKIPVG